MISNKLNTSLILHIWNVWFGFLWSQIWTEINQAECFLTIKLKSCWFWHIIILSIDYYLHCFGCSLLLFKMDTTGNLLLTLKLVLKLKYNIRLFQFLTAIYAFMVKRVFFRYKFYLKTNLVLNIKIEIKLIRFLYWVQRKNWKMITYESNYTSRGNITQLSTTVALSLIVLSIIRIWT